jgi:phosphatidylinositol alpha-mannosyltransferase
VTRHIEALATELNASGHEARILSPWDPDDALARRLHHGMRPHAIEPPADMIRLGRTLGWPANGAVSNLAYWPGGVARMRRELRAGGYDVVHIHEPVAALISWDALCSTRGIPLVGTFHAYSENALSNGIGNLLGARRRINHLHARIAVSEAAAWTARRFFGGRYRIVPNGVYMAHDAMGDWNPATGDRPPLPGDAAVTGCAGDRAGDCASGAGAPSRERPLRILFVGQAVERKGLPVLLRAFEALREHVPATLTLVGADPEDVAPLLLDERGVSALGKVSEERKASELAAADVLCAPSLGGESFGMVLTEAFAARTPVVASDIPGYRDVVRDGREGVLTPPGDALALAQALRELALEPARRAAMASAARARAERFAWPHVAAEVVQCYEQALAVGQPRAGAHSFMVRHGLAPADLLPAVRPQRLPSLQPPPAERGARSGGEGRRRGWMGGRSAVALLRRGALACVSLAGLALALLALRHIGVERVLTSLLASSPGLLIAGLAAMCAAMVARGFAWYAILQAAPTWRRARRRDAMQGTFIGVLMSATLPARLGEPSRALIVARRLGRARETLPVVLGTMVSQTLLNLLALGLLGIAMFANIDLLKGHHEALIGFALAPLAALAVVLLAPALLPAAALSRSARLQALLLSVRRSLVRVRAGLGVFRHPRQAAIATVAQLGAWGLQLLSCWVLLMALGLDGQTGIVAAAAVLFAVNVTAVVPATPANVGVFQAACIAVLAGAYHVSTADALAYGIVLQAVEVTTALIMGMPALVNEGLSWKDVRLRTMHAAPVKLPALPERARAGATAQQR